MTAMPFLEVVLRPGETSPLTAGFVVGDDGSVRVPLERRLLVGRGRSCDVVVNSAKMARDDTVFEPSPEGWVALNLGNNQGMYVNKSKTMRSVLRHGDVIYLFGVTFRFVDPPGEPGGSPRAGP